MDFSYGKYEISIAKLMHCRDCDDIAMITRVNYNKNKMYASYNI